MQILDRTQFLLSSSSAPGAMIWLIKIVQIIASNGLSYIREVATTAKLLDTVLSLIEGPTSSGKEDIFSKAKKAAAIDILQLVVLLCREGKAIVNLLSTKGGDCLSLCKEWWRNVKPCISAACVGLCSDQYVPFQE